MQDNPVDDRQRRTRLRTIVESARRQAAGSRVAARQHFLDPVIEPPAGDGGPFPAIALRGYKILREVHRGGQGVVYEATQQSTRRRVAIKIMREGPFASTGEMARFDREVEILAQLNHPNIVTIHDSGQAGGHFYFVMDFVAGTLDEFIQGRPRGDALLGRLRLFEKVCGAVNMAHARGIIHRDLKPSNIRVDESGQPRVLDFGLAKTTPLAPTPPSDGVDSSPAYVTETGQFVGSLPWASPEQAQGAAYRVDIRSDVYSLGVILYQMLTGRLPHEITDNLHDMLSRVVRGEPRRPSALNSAIDSDLEVIVLKCLAKQPDRRYGSAGELGRDMERYLHGEAIDARRDSGWYVVRKTLRRHRAPVAIAAAFIVVTLASTIALSIMYRRQAALLGEVSRQRDKAIAAESMAESRQRQAERDGYLASIAAADAAIAVDDGGTAMSRLLQTPAALRRWEWRFLVRSADQSIATIHGPASYALTRVFFSPSGRYVAAIAFKEDEPVELHVWDWQRGAQALSLKTDTDQMIQLCFTPDEQAFEITRVDGRVTRHDFGTGAMHEQSLRATVADDMTMLLLHSGIAVGYRVVNSKSSVRYGLRDNLLHRGEFPLDPSTTCGGVVMTPDGAWFAVMQSDGAIWVSSTTPGSAPLRASPPSNTIFAVALSNDGGQFATGSGDGVIRQWQLERKGVDLVAARATRSIQGSAQRVIGLTYSPDGALLVSASADKTIRIWRAEDGELVTLLRGHHGPVSSVAFSADGARLASGSLDSTLKIWNLSQPPARLVRRDFGQPISTVEFSGDGSQLLVVTGSQTMLLDASNGQTRQAWRALPATDRGTLSRDGRRVTLGSYDGKIRVLDLADGRELRSFQTSASRFPRIAVNARELELAWTDLKTENQVFVWDALNGQVRRRLEHSGTRVTSLAYSPDGSTLATGAESGQVRLWNPANGRMIWEQRPHRGAIMTMAFSPEGLRLAIGSNDTTVSVVDARTGVMQFTIHPQIGDVWCTAFNPDGTRLAIAGRDRSVRIFDTAEAREILALRGPTGTVTALNWSPDGRRLAAGSWANEVFIWDAGLSAAPPASTTPVADR